MADNPPILKNIIEDLESVLVEKSEADERKKLVDTKYEALLDAARSVQKVYGGTIPEWVSTPTDSSPGITAQIREIMKSQGATWNQPTQVKALLEQRKFLLEKYSNPMAMIHQVLKRLEEQGELVKHTNG